MPAASPAEARPKVSADQLALKIDPYCRMSLEHHSVSEVYTYKDKQYGFCSSYCKDEFAKAPETCLIKLQTPSAARKE
jgi:YHS domain-containing protein